MSRLRVKGSGDGGLDALLDGFDPAAEPEENLNAPTPRATEHDR